MISERHVTFRISQRTLDELTGMMAAEGMNRSAMLRSIIRRAFNEMSKRGRTPPSTNHPTQPKEETHMSDTNTRPATEWQETDREQAAEAYEEYTKRKNSLFAKRPPKGKSVWRWLPPIKGKKPVPFTYVWVHFFNNPSNLDELLMVGICPSKQRGEPCPLCPFVSSLRRSGVPADKDVADKIRAREIILANAVRLDEEKGTPVVMPLDVPVDVHTTLMQILRDKVDGVDFTHPDKGYNVIIEREGSGKNDTKYKARLAPRQMAITNREWLTQMIDLDTVFTELDTKLLSNLLGSSDGGPVTYRAPASQQLAATPQGPSEDMVENPLTGEWEPRQK